jgi:homoserine kinase
MKIAADRVLPIRSVKVRVPASTSNLGPGFDCLGLALRLYNEVQVAHEGPQVTDPFLLSAAEAFFKRAHLPAFPFSCSITGNVPRSRGLGSSVTVRLGVLAGLNELAGSPLDRNTIFQICAELEGHPDNASASAFGGFTICLPDGRCAQWDVPDELHIVLAIPHSECGTEEARKVVPSFFSRADTVSNIAHACRIAAAIASHRFDLLAESFEDRIHQPARSAFVPFLRPAILAGRSAGALGGWLSGSGSTIACATLQNPEAVAEAMRAAIGDCDTLILSADNEGYVAAAAAE